MPPLHFHYTVRWFLFLSQTRRRDTGDARCSLARSLRAECAVTGEEKVVRWAPNCALECGALEWEEECGKLEWEGKSGRKECGKLEWEDKSGKKECGKLEWDGWSGRGLSRGLLEC